MFDRASDFKQNLNIWLKWVTKVSHYGWCSGGAVCNTPPTKSSSITPSMMPAMTPTENKNACDRKGKTKMVVLMVVLMCAMI